MSGAPGGLAAQVRAARPADVPRIFELMRGLAGYERLLDEVTGTAAGLREALFGEPPAAECLVLERGATLEGYALYFPVFSSFRNRRMMWLEDLYVDPAARATGGGRRLMAALARLCLERRVTRIGWIVLDWNELAIGFYQRLGGREQPAKDWLQYVLDEDGVRRLAQGEAEPAPG
jgi:GNAT superfamily N-acetyltransferase